MKVHPAAKLFPQMEGDELKELAESIKYNGLLHPILMLDGKIIDGRNRLAACEIAGIPPHFKEVTLTGDPYEWVWSTNAERRHLSQAQRAQIRVNQLERSSEWRAEQERRWEEANKARSESQKGKPKERRASVEDRRSEPAKKRGKVATKIANEIGVGRSTVERAQELNRKAPDLADKVAKGEIKSGPALKKARARAKDTKAPVAATKKGRQVTVELPLRVTSRVTVYYADGEWDVVDFHKATACIQRGSDELVEEQRALIEAALARLPD